MELQAGDSGEATRRSFEHWLAQHPDHTRAWQRIDQVSQGLRGAATPLGAALARAAIAPPASRKRRTALKALALLVFVGGTARVAQVAMPWQQWLADARTTTGERRELRLPDGSRLALNSASAVDIRFDAHERHIRLLAGEIRIVTARDPSGRPFIVETPEGELLPLGTRFSVRRYDGATQAAVIEGAVALRPCDRAGIALTLRAGEQSRFTRSEAAAPSPADETRLAWTDGMLVASGMRLADFLAELSRHRPGRISCDPAVADLRLSGSYPLADTDRILRAVAASLPVEIHTLTRYWVTVAPAR